MMEEEGVAEGIGRRAPRASRGESYDMRSQRDDQVHINRAALAKAKEAQTAAQNTPYRPAQKARSDAHLAPLPSIEARVLALFKQRDTQEGRLDARLADIEDRLRGIENHLGASVNRKKGHPESETYRVIREFRDRVAEAVLCSIANEAERTALLGIIDRTKRSVQNNLALRVHSGDGGDPTKANREQIRRAKIRAAKASAT